MNLLASSNFTSAPSAPHKLALLCIRHKYSSIYFKPFYCHLLLQKKIRLGISSFHPLLFQSILPFSLSTTLALKSAILLIYWQTTVNSKCHPRVTLSEAHVLSDWVAVVTMDYSRPYFPKQAYVTKRPNQLGRLFWGGGSLTAIIWDQQNVIGNISDMLKSLVPTVN